jgi:hypothetical protein
VLAAHESGARLFRIERAAARPARGSRDDFSRGAVHSFRSSAPRLGRLGAHAENVSA